MEIAFSAEDIDGRQLETQGILSLLAVGNFVDRTHQELLPGTRDEAHLRPWLVQVAAYEAKAVLRNQRRRDKVEVTADAAGGLGGGDPAVDVSAIDLRAAMEHLDPDDSALLAMRYGAGFDSNELAVALGISPSGTRSRLERLLKRLREDLGDG